MAKKQQPATLRFKNVSPLGDLEVPALGRVVAAGEEFEVDDFEFGVALHWQPGNFQSLDDGVDWGDDPATAGQPAPAPAEEQPAATDEEVNA